MGRRPFSEEQVEGQRSSVIRAAEGLFAELGYEGVTLRAIANTMGQSPAAPYRYFESKAAIFNASRVAAYKRFAAAQEASSDEATDSIDRISRLGDAYTQFAIDEPDAYRLMFELKPSEAARTEELDEAGSLAWQPLRDAIGEAVDDGFLEGDADVLAHLFWAGLHGVVSLHLAAKFRHGLDLESLRAPMKQLLFMGGRGIPKS